MSDADKKPEVPPATEPAALETPPLNTEPSTNTEAEAPQVESAPDPAKTREATIEQARIFLKDAETQKATPEQRTEFLKSKGLSNTDIQDLLKEATQDTPPFPSPLPTTPLPKEDRPPIITYPEFLTTPSRPPPLITPSGFLNTLYTFTGLSTLIYSTSKLVLEPMVDSLTTSRLSLAESASDNLSHLITKLEATVSTIPPYPSDKNNLSPRPSFDAISQYDDPTELFHRDIGIQTEDVPRSSFQINTPLFPNNNPESSTAYQSRRLGGLVKGLKQVNEGLISQTEGYQDVKTVIDVLSDDLDVLARQSAVEWSNGGGAGGYNNLYGARAEPDDEIRRAKENIRRVKGVLLSTRSFPGSAANGSGNGVITAGGTGQGQQGRSGFGIGR
ncbi:putative PEX14/17 peroxisomal biogenesis factor 14/17 [Triangularia verruculosa]|uniref:Peroxisomal membrane protein PEX14 n=1 Tax=Triangularia verruculosa TaxID=2587418 RepID=A0AAN6XSB9_9PEZI|nr:putative PEX14/17 peroxisomal biogenesis factor 14/17 [Triangularia verruculosa]